MRAYVFQPGQALRLKRQKKKKKKTLGVFGINTKGKHEDYPDIPQASEMCLHIYLRIAREISEDNSDLSECVHCQEVCVRSA